MHGKNGVSQQDTVEALLEAARRPSGRVNLRRGFVQKGHQNRPVPGPLHGMLKAHDERAFDLYLLHRALVSSEPWSSRPLASRVWARALGLHTQGDGGSAALSKVWRRLEETHKLVERGRDGRRAVVTSLREDGSGEPYTSPDGRRRVDSYFTVPFEYWTAEQRWYATLSFPAKAMLMIASTLAPGFVLPTERAPEWYGVSPESAERGLSKLRDVGLLTRTTRLKSAPLSPNGITQEHRYTLAAPFGRPKRPALRVVRAADAS